MTTDCPDSPGQSCSASRESRESRVEHPGGKPNDAGPGGPDQQHPQGFVWPERRQNRAVERHLREIVGGCGVEPARPAGLVIGNENLFLIFANPVHLSGHFDRPPPYRYSARDRNFSPRSWPEQTGELRQGDHLERLPDEILARRIVEARRAGG